MKARQLIDGASFGPNELKVLPRRSALAERRAWAKSPELPRLANKCESAPTCEDRGAHKYRVRRSNFRPLTLSTSDAARPSCSNVKGSNERPQTATLQHQRRAA